jgi:membrane-bound metal-dependent hydrolase YbcI (DUF457 family)
MPITPFHFGLGFAVKAALSKRFSLLLFIALQVVIDCESLYNLVRQRYPVHRFLHTFLGAALLAVGASILFAPAVSRVLPKYAVSKSRLLLWLLANALFATWSHVVLDGIMHADAQPFWPISDRNPLLSLVGLSTLHIGLIALGMLGLLGRSIRGHWESARGEPRSSALDLDRGPVLFHEPEAQAKDFPFKEYPSLALQACEYISIQPR